MAGGDGVREEVVNVKLAQLLEDRDVVSLPEEVISGFVEERRMPDVMTGTLFGIRVVIEGRIGQSDAVRESLVADCEQRIAEGIAPMAVAVAYPEGINEVDSLDQLEQNIVSSEFQINVVTEGRSRGWASGDIEDLGDFLRGGYADLVEEDVVQEAVDTIDEKIDRFVTELSGTDSLGGTEDRLREIVIVPNE